MATVAFLSVCSEVTLHWGNSGLMTDSTQTEKVLSLSLSLFRYEQSNSQLIARRATSMDALLLGRGQVLRRSNFASLAILTVAMCRPVYIGRGGWYTPKLSRDEVVSPYHRHSKAYHQGMSSSFSGLCNLGRPPRPLPPHNNKSQFVRGSVRRRFRRVRHEPTRQEGCPPPSVSRNGIQRPNWIWRALGPDPGTGTGIEGIARPGAVVV